MMIRTRYARAASGERGTALVVMAFAAAGLAGLSAALLGLSHSSAKEQRGSKELTHARYVAEAGISAALFDIEAGGDGALGTENNPVTWGGASYWVTRTNLDVDGDMVADDPDDLLQLVATGVDDRAANRVEVTFEPVMSTIFQWGAFGDEFMNMDSNSRVDSYNAALGTTYAAQVAAGGGTYALDNGDVGSNGNVLLAQNSMVWGDAIAGPGSTTTILGNAEVSGSWAPSLETMEMPPIEVPVIASLGPKTIHANTTLAAGDYNYSALRINNGMTLTVNGPARIVVTNFQIRSNAKLMVNATNGPVEMWVIDDFVVNSNTLIASTAYRPRDIQINLLSDNVISPEVIVDLDEIDFDSNAKLYGTIYAPNAAIEVDSNFELFGSLVARSVDLDSNSRIHYDESLATEPGLGEITYEVLCWRPLPYKLD